MDVIASVKPGQLVTFGELRWLIYPPRQFYSDRARVADSSFLGGGARNSDDYLAVLRPTRCQADVFMLSCGVSFTDA